MSAALEVLRPGLLTTIQDLGRWGLQSMGVPVAGPMDAYSHRLANRLAGNQDEAAALEVTLEGPELRARGGVICAVAGADFAIAVDGRPVLAPVFEVQDGATIRFGRRLGGCRATLAVRGGLDVAPVFGSRATSLAAHLGPFGGRALRSGDLLPLAGVLAGDAPVGARPLPGAVSAPPLPLPLPQGGARLRVTIGPGDRYFAPAAIEALLRQRFVVTPQSNRMGYRLAGAPIPGAPAGDILSEATPMGSLQVVPSGQIILLMADRQTTGGYARLATVISADLPIAGQLAPGDWIEWQACTIVEAATALREREAALGAQP